MGRVASYPMPSEVLVDATGDHVRYLLPRRQLGRVHWVGVVPIGFGVAMLGVLAYMAQGVSRFRSGDQASRIFAVGFGLILLLFALPALRTIVFGMVVMIGRTEIRLINGKLSAREHAGPVFWTRRFKKQTAIERVSVRYGDGTLKVDGKRTDYFKKLASTAGLGVEAGPQKSDRFMLTIGYPKEMLLPIGLDLAQRLHVGFHEGLMVADWLEDENEKADTKS